MTVLTPHSGLTPPARSDIADHQHYFDTVEKSPLTAEQCAATAAMPDRMLLVAAAGSGKTSVMVAKVGYALLTGQQQADRILVLAFNNKAAQELHQRIHTRLRHLIPPGQSVKTKTFHALGLEIISAVQGRKPTVAVGSATSVLAAAQALNALITRSLNQDTGFAQEWLLFRLFYCRDVRNPASFKTGRQWRAFMRVNGNGLGRSLGFLSLNGEMLASQCELAIANWLYMQGVSYKYVVVPGRPGLRFWRRPRQHAFFLIECRRWVLAPAHVGHLDAAWQAKMADRILCLTFEDMVGGSLFSLLRKALSAWGAALQPRTGHHMLQRLGGDMSMDELAFLSAFLHHARSNALNGDDLRLRATNHAHADRAGVLTGFLAAVLKAHADQLRSSDQLDFQEMISRATAYVTSGRYMHPYCLILVDEFQDTSQASAMLIKAMLQQSTRCKLFAVGDDWQSIYRFAGADTRVFTQFDEYFGVAATYFLSASFRFNQGIADVATRFIQQNPGQIKKQVRARDTGRADSVDIRRYGSQAEMALTCANCVHEIQQESGNAASVTVYILGRYRHQRPAELAQWQSCYPSLHLTFKTMHAAKGLEADYVLVLGLHGGRHAFPSQIDADPLLQMVMPVAEAWPDAEERRLFYVAMTRARHKVFLIASAQAPSSFVTELANYPGVLDAGSIT